MNQETETGQQYPKVTLADGSVHEVKFERGTFYTLENAGAAFNPIWGGPKMGWTCSLKSIVDTLKVCIGFKGTPEELTELAYDDRDAILLALVEAWGKVSLPSIQRRNAAAAARKAAEQPARLPN